MDKILNKPKFKLFLILLITTVVVAGLVGFAVNKFFGKPQGGEDINSFMPDKLMLGSSFTLDEVVEYMQYDPLWIKTESIEVKLFAIKGADGESELEENAEVISYIPDTRTFNVDGVGSGKIQITSKFDSTVVIELPFKTSFRSNNTETILRDNYPRFFADNIVTSSEIQTVKEIKLPTANRMNLIDFSACSKLERVVLSTSKDIVLIDGLDTLNSNVHFMVYNEFYYDYLETDEWSKYYERLFPIVNLDDNKNSVVFEFNGGSMEKVNKNETSYFDSISDGNTLSLSDYSITKEGYTFLGWYTSLDKGVTFATKITEDYVFDKNTKLYANWVVNEYDICYNDRFVSDIPDMQHAKYDEQFHISSFIPSRTGYTFLGWASSENSSEVAYLPGATVQKLTSTDKDVVNLYGVWAANNYTIKYHANGGSNAPSAQENLAYGADVQLSLQTPGRTGYAFLGWSTNQNDTDYQYVSGATVKNLVSDSEGVVTLYAIWAANDYSIHYNANGGSNAPIAQENLKYGETVVLTSDIPQRVGYVFLGWSKSSSAIEPELLPGASVKNLVSTSGGEVTLYAVWELASFYLTYDANGGQGAPNDDVLKYMTPAKVTTTVPTREGHTFLGWATSQDGEVSYTSGSDLDVAAVNVLFGSPVLYAVWEANYYTITVSTTNASVSGVSNNGSYQYGTSITVYVEFSKPDNRSFVVDGVGRSSGYTFTMPAHDVHISAYSDKECVATGSLVMLADGTQKKVEDIVGDEMLLAWDFKTGQYVAAPIAIIFYHGESETEVVNLRFSDGTIVRIIGDHGFFDYELNTFVYISKDNYHDYLGHHFAQVATGEEMSYQYKELVDVYVTLEHTGSYSIQTAFYDNFIVESMFSLTPPLYPGFFNYFEIGENMMYDQEQMKRDIETYGLYTYDDWKDYLTYEQFIAFSGPYLKVSVGKGLITEEEIIALIKQHFGG